MQPREGPPEFGQGRQCRRREPTSANPRRNTIARGRPARGQVFEPQCRTPDSTIILDVGDREGVTGSIGQPLVLPGDECQPSSSLNGTGTVPISGIYGSVAKSATSDRSESRNGRKTMWPADGSGSGQLMDMSWNRSSGLNHAQLDRAGMFSGNASAAATRCLQNSLLSLVQVHAQSNCPLLRDSSTFRR